MSGTLANPENGGRALKLQTDIPHLVSMGGDRLSTSVTLHPIPPGRVTLGSGSCVDIPVHGTGVLSLHCHIENSEGVVTVYPLSENLSIDGIKVTGPTRLSQGVMLTIGRSNYMRFNHPAEAKLMKSVLPNPRISMAPIQFEQDLEQKKFNKKPPVVPRKSPRESLSSSDGDEAPPSNIMTKVSKFEYLAAQNFKKSISPKVFSANLVTVNTPAKDVLGKAPPDLHNFTKNLPQSALNYSELNQNEKSAQVTLFGRKMPQYVNVGLTEKTDKTINNRVVIYENGCIPKSCVNFDHNELNKSKNVNISKELGEEPQRHHSELRRNQAQQDRIKEQEMEKAEQARLEEILSMCAEYEKQSQSDKNKPIPNRIKTNGSLPRDKRPYGPPSPSYTTPPASPLDVLHNELIKQNNHTYENVKLQEMGDRISPYENVAILNAPPSPRTRIKTFLQAKEPAVQENELILKQNLNNSKETVFPGENRKTTPTKFILPLDNDKIENQVDKTGILDKIARIKQQMAEIEVQEEELHREIVLEHALITGEHKAKLCELEKYENLRKKLLKRAQLIEDSMRDCQLKQDEDQNKCKIKLEEAQENFNKTEEKLNATCKSSREHEAIFEEYLQVQELLDVERKNFEDLEFHHLEEEANWLASKEELQREINDLTKKIDKTRNLISDLEVQKQTTSKMNTSEYRTIDQQKNDCLTRLEQLQSQLNSNKIHDLSCSLILTNSKLPEETYNMSQSFNEKLLHEKSILEVGIVKFPSQDDIDRISKVTLNAPLSLDNKSRKTIESLKEIERIRQLHLHQNGSEVIENERLRVQALKERAQLQVKTEWEQRRMDSCENTVNNKELHDEEKSDFTASSIVDCESPARPLSELSDMSFDVSTLNRRTKPPKDKQRPLTRYLPIRSELNLRQHIESAGHQVVLCPHVLIDSATCKGFLHKRGSKLNGWSRRWFVFDRNKHTFTYYSDKTEKKTRGGAYFQAIEEVYLDHLNNVKSPNPQLTFIVKTHERCYHLMAPSPEAMRIWVDVVFTGAEGYREFDHGN